MKGKQGNSAILLLLLGLLLSACRPVATVTPTVTTAPILTDTPVASTDTPSVPPTETPFIPQPPTMTPPTLGPAIPHLKTGQRIDITYIHMISTTAGWGIGGQNQASDHVFRTRDGGTTWQDVTPPEPIPQDQDDSKAATGYYLDRNSAWIIYRLNQGFPVPDIAAVWRTNDGGASWQPTFLDTTFAGEGFYPSDMVFVDGQHGWFLIHMGGGMHHDYVSLYATDDGGVTWQALLTPYNDGGIQSLDKTGMAFFDERTGWLTIGNLGVANYMPLFYTNDGGSTWQEINIPAPQAAPDLFEGSICELHSPQVFSQTSAKFALNCKFFGGDSSETYYYLYATLDGGSTWRILPYPGGSLEFFDERTGLALGRSIYKTSDGGQTWTQVKQVNWDGQFSFVNENLGWAVAHNENEIALVKTTNGGVTWQEIEPRVAP